MGRPAAAETGIFHQTALLNTSREMSGEEGEADGADGAAAMNIEAEGPTLLSTTRVNRTFVFQQLRQTVEQLRGGGAISDEAKILVMSGTHGTEDGVSALTDIDRNNVDDGYAFYTEDCRKVGIKAGPSRRKTRPPLSAREPFHRGEGVEL